MATEAPNYRPGNILDKEPTVIAAAIFAVVNFVIAAGSWTVEPDTLAQGNTALVLVLALFVRSRSTSNSTAQVLVEKAAIEAEVATREGVGAFLMAAQEDELAAKALQQDEVPKKAAPRKRAPRKAPRPADH